MSAKNIQDLFFGIIFREKEVWEEEFEYHPLIRRYVSEVTCEYENLRGRCRDILKSEETYQNYVDRATPLVMELVQKYVPPKKSQDEDTLRLIPFILTEIKDQFVDECQQEIVYEIDSSPNDIISKLFFTAIFQPDHNGQLKWWSIPEGYSTIEEYVAFVRKEYEELVESSPETIPGYSDNIEEDGLWDVARPHIEKFLEKTLPSITFMCWEGVQETYYEILRDIQAKGKMIEEQ